MRRKETERNGKCAGETDSRRRYKKILISIFINFVFLGRAIIYQSESVGIVHEKEGEMNEYGRMSYKSITIKLLIDE